MEYNIKLNNDDWKNLLIDSQIHKYLKDLIHQQVLPLLIRFL